MADKRYSIGPEPDAGTAGPTMESNADLSRPTPAQVQAAGEFAQAILRKLRTEEGVHAETAIAAAARMAGSYRLRSLPVPLAGLTPGSAIPCELADEAGAELVATLAAALAAYAIDIDRARVPAQVPEANAAQHSLLQMQLMFWRPFQLAVHRHRLSDREAALAAAGAAALLIRDAAPVLDPLLAFSIATRGFSEGARTVPIEAPDEDREGPADKPWWKFW